MSRETWRTFSLALLAAGLALGACSRSSTSPVADASGTYVLSTVNGDSLPATISQSADTTIAVTAGEVTLSRDASASYSLSLRYTVGTVSSPALEADDGVWAINGDSIQIAWQQSGIDTFMRSRNTLTETAGGLTYVFLR